MEFSTQTTPDGGCRMAIGGDFDIYCAAEAKASLIGELRTHPQLEQYLSHVRTIDSAGFQLLALAKLESRRLGGELRIVGHSTAVREVIEFYNMVGFFGDPLVIPASDDN